MDFGLEKTLVIGIVLFAIVAVMHGINTVRGIKRASSRRAGEGRPRRPVASEESARAIARGLLREIEAAHSEAVARMRQTGAAEPELAEALDRARDYFRERVESRLRPVFHQTVDEVFSSGTAPDETV